MRFATLVRFTTKGTEQIPQTTNRAQQFLDQARTSGIRIQELLWNQGRYDGLILFDAADAATAAAAMLRLASKGFVQTETMLAWDAAEMGHILSKLS